jgi:hypothetical protein
MLFELITFFNLVLIKNVFCLPSIFLYVSNDGTNGINCGVEFDKGCRSFIYIFNYRFNDTEIEKGVFLLDGYSLSSQISLDIKTPKYYLFGDKFKQKIHSKVIIPANSGCFICKYNVYFGFLF